MIISHKNKFIFIKTEKTAGTSIEIALSKYCGPDDIITPLTIKDDAIREKLGYRGAQNYKIPYAKYSKKDYLELVYHRKRQCYFNHMSSSDLIAYIDQDIWDSYYKFCFERNPWDKVISWYYWEFKKEPRPTISEFVQSGDANIINGFELYTVSSEIVVDQVYLYEQLTQSMIDISKKLKLKETIKLPFAKAGYRKDKRDYKDILTRKDNEKIAKVYAREIAYFGYKW